MSALGGSTMQTGPAPLDGMGGCAPAWSNLPADSFPRQTHARNTRNRL